MCNASVPAVLNEQRRCSINKGRPGCLYGTSGTAHIWLVMPVGMFPVSFFIGMVVRCLILPVDVGVAVAMLMGMGMHQLAMPMLVGMNMGMLMGMLQRDGVFHHQDGGNDHNGEANIARSTFYAHFETKDDLLYILCGDIFHHVFTQQLPQEEDTPDIRNLELKLGHILYHLKECRVNLGSILAADSDGLFMAYFKQYLARLFSRYAMLFPQEVPEDFLIHHLAGSFAETVKWWVSRDAAQIPETVARNYMLLVRGRSPSQQNKRHLAGCRL